MDFVKVTVECSEDLKDILIYELSEIEFEAFLDNDKGFEASVSEGNYNEENTKKIFQNYIDFGNKITYKKEKVAKQNWNKLWESNYPYVEINEDCLIRASFHTPPRPYKYELVITPKMSFGTGHHSTTSLMVNSQMKQDHKGKVVMDAGSGTGILAIMAMKLGAQKADACDIEDWAVENAIENAEINNVTIKVQLGSIEGIEKESGYDILLANINRNVILEQIPVYAGLVVKSGIFITSGFYEKDVPLVQEKAEANGFELIDRNSQKDWCCLTFKKK